MSNFLNLVVAEQSKDNYVNRALTKANLMPVEKTELSVNGQVVENFVKDDRGLVYHETELGSQAFFKFGSVVRRFQHAFNPLVALGSDIMDIKRKELAKDDKGYLGSLKDFYLNTLKQIGQALVTGILVPFYAIYDLVMVKTYASLTRKEWSLKNGVYGLGKFVYQLLSVPFTLLATYLEAVLSFLISVVKFGTGFIMQPLARLTQSYIGKNPEALEGDAAEEKAAADKELVASYKTWDENKASAKIERMDEASKKEKVDVNTLEKQSDGVKSLLVEKDGKIKLADNVDKDHEDYAEAQKLVGQPVSKQVYQGTIAKDSLGAKFFDQMQQSADHKDALATAGLILGQ